jgi:3-oxoacyl-[acyl-carrier-protein] synthase II
MDTSDTRTLLRRQLELSRRQRARIAELEGASRAPLAICGTAVRFAGGITTPEAFWEFLDGDATTESAIPADRVGLRGVTGGPDPEPGRSYVDRASFVDDVDRFDAAFFGISAREAAILDPQQRMLLETAWEAIERTGIPVRRQDRLPIGVFVGLMASDYVRRVEDPEDLTALDPYYGTGGGHSLAAGRISYALGLSGPALAVDTACSSSLMALHLAAQSLRRGECRYAVVGGANLLLSPHMMVSLCQSGALAPDGRCKSFLDAADGYGRGEGAGALVLTTLDVAERERRPVLALVRGTAANHDGASSGLTVPNGRAQRDVVHAALGDAGTTPDEVGYVEAHGTGTRVGDPIELSALDEVFGTGDRPAPLQVGTVKARMGHLEGAAGVAGVITAARAVAVGRIASSVPPDAGPLNALVPWERLGIAVPRGATPWPDGHATRIAGVSSFGMSGTNVHAVLAEHRPEPTPEDAAGTGWPELVTVSAKTPEALRTALDAAADHLAGLDGDVVHSACHTLRAGRAQHGFRAAVVAHDVDGLVTALREAAATAGITRGRPAVVRLASDADGDALRTALVAAGRRLPALAALDPAGADDPTDVAAAFLELLGVAVDGREATAGVPLELAWEDALVSLCSAPGREPAHAILDVVAELFRLGADLDLDALRPTGASFLASSPTYPFQRTRHWVDEPTRSAAPDGDAPGPASAADADTARDGVVAFILAELAVELRATAPPDLDASFLDVGGDSFTAMQLTMKIEQRFGIEVPVDGVDLEVPLGDMVGALADLVDADAAAAAEGARA